MHVQSCIHCLDGVKHVLVLCMITLRGFIEFLEQMTSDDSTPCTPFKRVMGFPLRGPLCLRKGVGVEASRYRVENNLKRWRKATAIKALAMAQKKSEESDGVEQSDGVEVALA